MIEAKELRIGNYIIFDLRPDKWIKVRIETIEDCQRVTENSPYKYQGIPLTEEILLKCGATELFTESKDRKAFLLNKSIQVELIVLDNIVTATVIFPMFYMRQPIVKYLHQLQNFTYDVEGEELNIEL